LTGHFGIAPHKVITYNLAVNKSHSHTIVGKKTAGGLNEKKMGRCPSFFSGREYAGSRGFF
jgi:hypothetical protein